MTLLLERSKMESRLLAKANAREDASAILVLAREIPNHLRQAHGALWGLVRFGPVDVLQELGEAFQEILDETIGTLRQLSANNPHLAGLAGVQAEVEQLRQEHQERWPWFRMEDLGQALAESARGETLELDDAFAQIAGISREDWLRRVEDYQRGRSQKE